ncbi:hypothetical protein BDN72DRAFT_749426, partial [Pluteus cervinus]
GVPLGSAAVTEYAAAIYGGPIGESWVKRFMARHPDLMVRWTTSLEQCRANALNRPMVNEYFDMLTKIIEEFSIIPENMYNMDE